MSRVIQAVYYLNRLLSSNSFHRNLTEEQGTDPPPPTTLVPQLIKLIKRADYDSIMLYVGPQVTRQGREKLAVTWWDPHLNFIVSDSKIMYFDSKSAMVLTSYATLSATCPAT